MKELGPGKMGMIGVIPSGKIVVTQRIKMKTVLSSLHQVGPLIIWFYKVFHMISALQYFQEKILNSPNLSKTS